MKLICLTCGNYTYFKSDVQVHRSIRPTNEGIIVEDAVFDGFNWSDSSIRDALYDNVEYVLKQSLEVLRFDNYSGQYENTMITCGRCNSKRVTPPYSEWRPKGNYQSLQQELIENREEYKNLRKEKTYADNLPILWKP